MSTYTIKIMNNDGEQIRLLGATHVVIDKKLGTIDVCNTGKPTTRVELPRDGDVVYVVNANNKTVETLRTPVTVDVTTHQDNSPMTMHTTRAPSSRESIISDEPADDHDAERLEHVRRRHSDTTGEKQENQGEETTTHA